MRRRNPKPVSLRQALQRADAVIGVLDQDLRQPLPRPRPPNTAVDVTWSAGSHARALVDDWSTFLNR